MKYSAKILLIVIVSLIASILSTSVICAKSTIIENPNSKVYIDGKLVTFSDTPISINNNKLLSLKPLLKGLGIPVDKKHMVWDSSKKTYTINKDSIQIMLKQDSTTIYINGKSKKINVAPISHGKNKLFYVPVIPFVEALGYKASVDDFINSIYISKKNNYDRIKAILEKSASYMGSLNKYIRKSAFEQKVYADKIIKSFFNSEDTYKVDKDKEIIYSYYKTSSQDYSFFDESYVLKSCLYTHSSLQPEWVKSYTETKEYDDHVNESKIQSIILFNDILYTSLRIEKDSGNEIILKGNSYPIKLSNSGKSGQNSDKYYSGTTAIYVSKDTGAIKKIEISLKITSSKDKKYSETVTLSLTYSEINGYFDLSVPAEVRGDPNLEKGDDYTSMGNYAEAIKYYDAAIEQNPKNLKAYDKKAKALIYTDELDSAWKCYDKAIESNSDNAEAYYMKGHTLINETDKFTEAISLFDKAIELNPNYGWAYYDKGYCLYQLGKEEEAERYVKKANELDPDTPHGIV